MSATLMIKRLLLIVLFISMGRIASSQNINIKTNLLSDALLNANIGAEVGVAPRWSINLSADINTWTVNGHRWRHSLLQPEARYWLCRRFAGHFFGLHALGGNFNFGNIRNGIKFLGSDFSNLSDNRYQGWGLGAGVAYGYSWLLAKHWNLEAEIGIGYIFSKYDVFECVECGRKTASGLTHNYFGLTKAALNLVYVF